MSTAIDMKLFYEGDRLTFKKVFDANFKKLMAYFTYKWRHIPMMVKEELIADAFYVLFTNRQKLESENHISASLFIIAKRKMCDWYKQNRNGTVSLLDCDMLIDFGDDSQVEYEKLLERGIAKLPGRMRETVFLFFYKKMKVPEVAKAMGITTQTVLNLRNRAINKLLQLPGATKTPQKYFHI